MWKEYVPCIWDLEFVPRACLNPLVEKAPLVWTGARKLSCGWEILVNFLETESFTAGILSKVLSGRQCGKEAGAPNLLDFD